MSAHSNFPFAGIGGAIENGTNRLLNWAVYFYDLGRYQNPLEMAESPFASIVNISYKRSSLDRFMRFGRRNLMRQQSTAL